MNDHIAKNIQQVTDELDDMLENVRKVKGEKYAALISALMHAKHVVVIWSFVLDRVKVTDKTKEVVDDAFMKNFEQMITSFLNGMNFEDVKWLDAVKDARSFDTSLQNMMNQAFKNQPFGDSNAP